MTSIALPLICVQYVQRSKRSLPASGLDSEHCVFVWHVCQSGITVMKEAPPSKIDLVIIPNASRSSVNEVVETRRVLEFRYYLWLLPSKLLISV